MGMNENKIKENINFADVKIIKASHLIIGMPLSCNRQAPLTNSGVATFEARVLERRR